MACMAADGWKQLVSGKHSRELSTVRFQHFDIGIAMIPRAMLQQPTLSLFLALALSPAHMVARA